MMIVFVKCGVNTSHLDVFQRSTVEGTTPS